MSEMSLVIAVRFPQGEVDPNIPLLEQLINIMGKIPDVLEEYNGSIDYFSYDLTKSDNFEVNIYNKKIYVDYIIKQERDCSDIHIDIEVGELQKIVELAELKGFNISNYKLKIFYYYNGGCSGLNEVD